MNPTEQKPQRTSYSPGLLGPTLSQIDDPDYRIPEPEPDANARISPYEVDLSRRLPEPEPILSIAGQTVLSRGNLSAVVGEAKCKKTFLCSAIVGGLLSAAGYMGFDARELRVLWIDTEQALAHVQRVASRTHAIACLDCTENDEHLRVLALRELEPRRRMDMMVDMIYKYRPDLVVLDGISDLQYNTNDLEESEGLLTRLMKISSGFGLHILTVLHTNPKSDKARGHIGSALQRKAETVFYVHRVGQVSVVEPQFCRNEPFERFAFRINAMGHPELCDLPAAGDAAEDGCARLLRDEYGGAVERGVLVRRLAELEGLSETTARVRVFRAVQRGILRESEDKREVFSNV